MNWIQKRNYIKARAHQIIVDEIQAIINGGMLEDNEDYEALKRELEKLANQHKQRADYLRG